MADSIRFILNGQLHDVTGLPPSMTLLQYLRTAVHLTGTKEGCAEGDCGACTVAIGRLDGGKVAYKSINACIAFLPTLDGREVVTVERLSAAAGQLTPVQDAMVKCHASQCGFCTPGFVMALSTLVNNTADANDADIHDAIAGNLCRCTGYRPILDAARIANKAEDRALPSNAKMLAGIQRKTMLTYQTPEGKFYSPRSIEDLTSVLSIYPDATLLAGGTDVGLWVTKMHMDIPVFVYTGNIEALRHIRTGNGGLEIGAAVTYQDAFSALSKYDSSMEDMLSRFSSLHIRNAGTIGGNIANGSPIGDGPPPLIALGAKVVLRSKAGERVLELEDYFIAYRKQNRKPGEFVEKIIVPAKPDSVQFRVYKVSKRFDQDISAVCAAFALNIVDGVVQDARIAFGGMAGTPKRADKTEAALKGRPWNGDTLAQAQAQLAADYQPMTDVRASAEYRANIARNLLQRFFIETTAPETATRILQPCRIKPRLSRKSARSMAVWARLSSMIARICTLPAPQPIPTIFWSRAAVLPRMCCKARTRMRK
ncbi:MAG: xanthine dehydrogenase small subunit [Micavibrio sp.]|nr:xanthine dehydrogenase small subunit [Micavibrio sp.]